MTAVSACTALYAELPRLELRGISYGGFQESDLTLKEYVWKQCQAQIFAALKIEALPKRLVPSPSAANTEGCLGLPLAFLDNVPDFKSSCSSPSDSLLPNPGRLASLLDNSNNKNGIHNKQNKNGVLATSSSGSSSGGLPNTNIEKEHHRRCSSSSSGVLLNSNNDKKHHRRSPSTQLEWMEQDVAQAAKRLKLLDKMAQVQRQYLQMTDRKTVFQNLLTAILELTESDYGFIGEVLYDDNNDGGGTKQENMYLQAHAIASTSWDAAARKAYRDEVNNDALWFTAEAETDTETGRPSLFGSVLKDQRAVISNSPQEDPRYRCCCSSSSSVNTTNETAATTTTTHCLDHPSVLKSFLGVPFFDNTGKTMNGMVVIANTRRPSGGGYTHKDIEFLEPFVTLCGNLLQAYQQLPKHQHQKQSEKEKLYELELANVQLAQAHQEVLRQNAMQLQHFACASHEIRTPLNCIIGLSSLLQETELNPMQAESMQLISSSSELLLTVVNDVLDYSKLESGHVNVTIQPSNLQETLMGVVQSMEMKTRDKNIRVRTEYAPSLPPQWKTDRLRLQQILFNLLGNAFKFSPPHSCVDLKVELGPPNRPTVAAHAVPLRVPRVVRFIVQDYGCGIQPDQLENVFQPFVQAGDDTHRLYEGTGLGLAITSKLVAALGGCVYANSTVGVGSEFCMEFPYDQEEFDVEELAQRLSNTTVLLVPGRNMPEDRIPVMERILNSYGIDYRIFSSMDSFDHVVVQPSSHSSLADMSLSSCSSSQSDLLSDDSMQHESVCQTVFLPRERSYVCLIDESVYQREIWQRWREHPCSSVLLTFGPDYTVAETCNHYRDLLQILPSVLMQSLADTMEEAKALKAPNLKGRQGKKKFKKPAATNAPVREKHDISILVVEDNVINQKVLMALLKKIGYTQVNVVGDGSLAVDAVEHNKYDVVLMDVQMPVMDGLEATRIIGERQQEKFVQGDKTPAPKIVFVTASVDQELEEEATKLGAVGFVPKPFNLRQLETCMTEICRSLG